MKKKVNWWWVVATREIGTMRREEMDALSMDGFCNGNIAAKVFISKRNAEAQIRKLKLWDMVPDGIVMQIVSDNAWNLILDMYHRGRIYGVKLLS